AGVGVPHANGSVGADGDKKTPIRVKGCVGAALKEIADVAHPTAGGLGAGRPGGAARRRAAAGLRGGRGLRAAEGVTEPGPRAGRGGGARSWNRWPRWRRWLRWLRWRHWWRGRFRLLKRRLFRLLGRRRVRLLGLPFDKEMPTTALLLLSLTTQ